MGLLCFAECASASVTSATASVKDPGSFVTLAGRSPGSTDDIPAGITGKLKGGYTTTLLTGNLNPNLPTRGNLGGTFDHVNKPSYVSYGLSGSFADWGWAYQTENNGSWVNASIPPATAATSPADSGTKRDRLRRPTGLLFSLVPVELLLIPSP